MTGTYAVLVSSSAEPGVLVAARSGPPIALGLGKNENWVASDPVALVPWTRDVVFLEDGDVARVDAKSVKISDADGRPLDRATQRILWDAVAAEKGGYRHFMAKEIHEQPEVVGRTLAHYVDLASGTVCPPEGMPFDWKELKRISIVACGTAYLAGLDGSR